MGTSASTSIVSARCTGWFRYAAPTRDRTPFESTNRPVAVSRVALPVAVNETLYEAPNLFFGGTMSWYDPSYRGLARFDIDIANKTLTERPTLVGQTFTPGQYGYDSWLGFERSVQLDAHVYYLTGLGKVMGSAW